MVSNRKNPEDLKRGITILGKMKSRNCNCLGMYAKCGTTVDKDSDAGLSRRVRKR
jgi:hypothetical protein